MDRYPMKTDQRTRAIPMTRMTMRMTLTVELIPLSGS